MKLEINLTNNQLSLLRHLVQKESDSQQKAIDNFKSCLNSEVSDKEALLNCIDVFESIQDDLNIIYQELDSQFKLVDKRIKL